LLKKELEIFTFGDLLNHFPFRHIDKTAVAKIADINFKTEYIQVAGRLQWFELVGEKQGRRLVAHIKDNTGELELVWFKGISYVEKILEGGVDYLVFGKIGFFNGKPQMAHPDVEIFVPQKAGGKIFLEPIYSTTEKLKARGLNAKAISKLTHQLFTQLQPIDIIENLPKDILEKLQLMERNVAYRAAHFPKDEQEFEFAIKRLKFEELFIAQVRLALVRIQRHKAFKGVLFEKVGDYFNNFYNNHLPFALTNAQKRVLKEIRTDGLREGQPQAGERDQGVAMGQGKGGLGAGGVDEGEDRQALSGGSRASRGLGEFGAKGARGETVQDRSRLGR
jgi:ATP-dependent DNA helicase RecG